MQATTWCAYGVAEGELTESLSLEARVTGNNVYKAARSPSATGAQGDPPRLEPRHGTIVSLHLYGVAPSG